MAIVASTTVLLLSSIINPHMPPREIIGKVAVQLVPGAFGAVFASSQLGGSGEDESEKRKEQAGYGTDWC